MTMSKGLSSRAQRLTIFSIPKNKTMSTSITRKANAKNAEDSL